MSKCLKIPKKSHFILANFHSSILFCGDEKLLRKQTKIKSFRQRDLELSSFIHQILMVYHAEDVIKKVFLYRSAILAKVWIHGW